MNDLELHDIQEILSDISCDKLKGSQCLIVGATGALGRYIVYSLMELYKWTNDKNAKVAVLSRSREKAEEYFSEYMAEPQFSIIEGTVETTVLDNYTFDYIIHAGCISATLNFTSNPVEIISANIIGCITYWNLQEKWYKRRRSFSIKLRSEWKRLDRLLFLYRNRPYGSSKLLCAE